VVKESSTKERVEEKLMNLTHGNVMIRTYYADGRFYKGGWTNLDHLGKRWYGTLVLCLMSKGRCSLKTTSGGIIELILVD
jgi:hypothetical protein